MGLFGSRKYTLAKLLAAIEKGHGATFVKSLDTPQKKQKAMLEAVVAESTIAMDFLLKIFPQQINLSELLRFAAHSDQKKQKSVLFLINAGAPRDIMLDSKSRLIIRGGAWGNFDIVKATIDDGFINAQQEMGNTALHHAVMQGHVPMIRFLLDHGARPDLKNNNGITAFDVALTKGGDVLEQFTEKRTALPAPKAVTEDLPPVTVAMQENNEKWVPMGKDRIAFVGNYPDLGMKITEIFNFESCDKTTITQNLATEKETSTSISLDSIDASKAYAVYQECGGTLPYTPNGIVTIKKAGP